MEKPLKPKAWKLFILLVVGVVIIGDIAQRLFNLAFFESLAVSIGFGIPLALLLRRMNNRLYENDSRND